MNETTITVTGNVAKEPALRVTTTGTRVVSFRLASTERRFDKALRGWRDGDTTWWSVSCWRNMGDNVLDSLRVGDPVIVHGRVRVREYDKEGVRHLVYEIEASSVGHDLARGVSSFTKASFGAGLREPGPEDAEVSEEPVGRAGPTDDEPGERPTPSAA